MSQKMPSDGGQKGFAVGRGLLAAAETLNYSMGESLHHGPSSRQLNSMVSGMGGGGDGQDRNSQLPRRSGGGPSSHIGNSMKLFASLGLSPTDLNELAQIPEENISVETLPHLIMQLKNRKGESERGRMAGNPRDVLSTESSYRNTREEWEDSMRGGRLGAPMGGPSSARGLQGDFGYGGGGGSMQEGPGGARGYELDYGGGSGGGIGGGGGGGGGVRDRQYSELSRDHYGGGMGMGPPASDGVFNMQRRMDSPAPSQIQDFLGVMPHTFPHLCSLCDFELHSAMGWDQHCAGLRHRESRRLLLQIYPDWDPGMGPNRSSRSLMMETTNPSMGLLGDAPIMSMGAQGGGGGGGGGGGMPSSWGGGPVSGQNKAQSHNMQTKIRSRVVVAKYDRKPLSNKSLFALAHPFGTIVEHLVLKSKAFLEMQTHKEALNMVTYYQQKPAILYGKEITFYLSKELVAIEKQEDRGGPKDGAPRGGGGDRVQRGRPSQVVFFSNLPREAEKKMELLTAAKRFGTVEKHLFLNDEAFVQLGTPEDAEMLVKYYTLNPLTIKGRTVRLNICTKYKTLNVSRSRQGQGWSADDRSRRNSSGSRAASASSTKGPRSTSTPKGKEDKKDTKPAEEKEGEGSGDEVAGVMEGEENNDAEGDGATGGTDDPTDVEGADAEHAADPEAGGPGTDGEEAGPEGEVQEEKTESDGVDGGATESAESGAGGEQGTETEGDSQAETTTPGEMEAASSEEPGAKDNASTTEPAEGSEMADDTLPEDQEGSMEQDFPENMDDFVTLDELAEEEDMDSHSRDSKSGKSKKREMKVVNITGFKRGHNFRSDLLALAKPFGKVVKHLVLDLRPEAFLELSSEAEAKAMVHFYNGNVTPMVCGKPVRMYHSQTYPTIECGNSKVVYVGGIPHTKYWDSQILAIAEPFGKIRRFFLNRNRGECFIEMEKGEDAEKMAEAFRSNPPKFQHKRLVVYVSRKYKQLKYGHRPPGAPPEKDEKRPSKREHSEGESAAADSTPAKPPAEKEEQEPPAKKPKEEKSPATEETMEEEKEEEAQEKESGEEAAGAEQPSAAAEKEEEAKENADQPSESTEAQKMDTDLVTKPEEEVVAISPSVDMKNGEEQQTAPPPPAEPKPAPATLPLPPYDPSSPLGVEFVKMGYYCRVCFLFYSNEESAKKVHCSTQAHYDKLKKYLEKEKAKGKKVSL